MLFPRSDWLKILVAGCLCAMSSELVLAGTDGFPGFPPGFPPIFPPTTPIIYGSPPTPIASPFVGQMSETWESRANFMTPSFHLETNPTTIMGGGATISHPVMGIYEPGSPVAGYFIGAPSIAAQVSDGTKGLAISSAATTALITFNTPVSDFGAFWGSGSPSNGIAFRFFNADNAEIDDPITVSYSRNGHFPGGDGGLDWHGWHSTIPFKSVTFTGDYLAVDGLQASVPEPTPGFAMVAGACAIQLAGRRRR